MLFDVLTMMEGRGGAASLCSYAALHGFGYIVPGCTRGRTCAAVSARA